MIDRDLYHIKEGDKPLEIWNKIISIQNSEQKGFHA